MELAESGAESVRIIADTIAFHFVYMLVVKRLKRRGDQWVLGSENPAYRDIVLREEMETVIWGVVTSVIHPV